MSKIFYKVPESKYLWAIQCLLSYSPLVFYAEAAIGST